MICFSQLNRFLKRKRVMNSVKKGAKGWWRISGGQVRLLRGSCSGRANGMPVLPGRKNCDKNKHHGHNMDWTIEKEISFSR